MLALSTVLLPGLLAAQSKLPRKLAPKPTKPEITAEDLMTRLYIFADDSMMGRAVATEGNLKATAYLAREAERLGLKPGGDGGTFFQALPVVRYAMSRRSTLKAGGTTLTAGTDFVPSQGVGESRRATLQAVYGGVMGDTGSMISAAAAAGKLVVLRPSASGSPNSPTPQGAALIAVVNLDAAPEALINSAMSGGEIAYRPTPDQPARRPPLRILRITSKAADALLGTPFASAKLGAEGATVELDFVVDENPAPSRNVVAILEGSDPKLKHQYVAIGAHNDHTGMRSTPLNHDSVRTVAILRRNWRAANPGQQTPPESALRVNMDSLRALGPAHIDSVNNGADDDGSGSVAMLEVAERLATGKRPGRSVVFVWHTGEERGLWGAKYFTASPTVPRDSIVAQVNLDMIGRGRAEDTPGGGDKYLMAVGAARLSSELGALVESVNKSGHNLTLDYSWDANGHQQNIYCRSDHAEYARFGIPIVFFFTGLHIDYHQATDEPQYIDYPHMANIVRYVTDLMMAIGNRPTRLVVDKPKPDPAAGCRQ